MFATALSHRIVCAAAVAVLATTGLAGCSKTTPTAARAVAAGVDAVEANFLFHRLPKTRELTEAERHLGFDGFRALATDAAVKWDKDARLIIGGSNNVDDTTARTITSGYTFYFHTGAISRLWVYVSGNEIKFRKCRFPRPLSLYPLLPWGKQLVAGDHVDSTTAVATAKSAGKLDTKTFSLWLLQPKGYVDPVYYVTGNKFLNMGKTVIVNASTGKVVDTKILPLGMTESMDDAVKATDAVEFLPETPGDAAE